MSYILDEEQARKFGFIIERYDSLKKQYVNLQKIINEKQEEVNLCEDRLVEEKKEFEYLQTTLNKQINSYQELSLSQSKHIENLEKQKNPSNLKYYLFGAAIGAAIVGVIK